MEIVQSQDQFTVGVDGKPSRVTDYKLYFPVDFKKIQKPELLFVTDNNYIQPSFRIASGQIVGDVGELRKRKKANGKIEHALVEVNDGTNFYQTKTILTGESGIGFQVIPKMSINDYLHTHYKHEGEDDKVVDLFSAFDLWSLGSKGGERYWLVGKDVVWCLVNLYGQKNYHDVKAACWDMAQKYNRKKTYDQLLTDLVECTNKCAYRLYRSSNVIDYELVS